MEPGIWLLISGRLGLSGYDDVSEELTAVRLAHYDREGSPRAAMVVGDELFDVEEGLSKLGLGPSGRGRTVEDVLSRVTVKELMTLEGKTSRLGGGLPLGEASLRAPVLWPEKILCVALNYVSHVKEASAKPPSEPYFFTKFRNTITGPDEPILVPRVSSKVDWEVELAVIIGKGGRYIPRAEAMDHVSGYTVSNDVSFRDLQFPPGWPEKPNSLGQNWVKGKGLDSAFPIGPWLVTKDEVEDPHNLRLMLSVNGDVKQDSATSEMVFRIPELIEYVSAGMTLVPGDIISTGTPPGVAAFSGQPYLKDGDVVEASVEKIGTLRNPVQAEKTER